MEILLAVAVLAVGTLVLSRTLASAASLADSTRQRTSAIEAARRVLEELQDEDFALVFARYNAVPEDDPGGIGSAPGASFSVDGLEAVGTDADGLVGEIVFPAVAGELREDVELSALGMPLDLDASGAVDGADHAADYRLLPVLVRVVWRGHAGPMQVELRTILAQR